MQELKYLAGYPETITSRVNQLILENRLGDFLIKKYPAAHTVRTDKALYDFTIALKNEFLQKSHPLDKVIYDTRLETVDHVLGMHYFISKTQGKKLKSRHEIKIASFFKHAPAEFLKMIVVHELAHMKEKDHNKGFYKLCEYMEPDYYQIEFDTLLYLTYLETADPLYK